MSVDKCQWNVYTNTAIMAEIDLCGAYKLASGCANYGSSSDTSRSREDVSSIISHEYERLGGQDVDTVERWKSSICNTGLGAMQVIGFKITPITTLVLAEPNLTMEQKQAFAAAVETYLQSSNGNAAPDSDDQVECVGGLNAGSANIADRMFLHSVTAIVVLGFCVVRISFGM